MNWLGVPVWLWAVAAMALGLFVCLRIVRMGSSSGIGGRGKDGGGS